MPAGSDSPFWVPIWFSNGIAPLLVRKFGKAAMAGIIIASYTTETFVMDMPVMNAAVIALANGFAAAEGAGLLRRILVYGLTIGGEGIDPSYLTFFVPLCVVPIVSLMTSQGKVREPSIFTTDIGNRMRQLPNG